jgi:type I restriction enzyme S subunit
MKAPQIRFNQFKAEWKDEKIGDVFSETTRTIVLKDHQRYELITVKRRNAGVVSRGHLYGREILVKNYSQLQTGDFVISKRQVVHGATGMIPPDLDGAIVSNEYLLAVNSDKLLTEFMTILAGLPIMRRKFFLSSYGVDIEKLFFDVEDWKKRSVTIPHVPEQTKIGNYFRELDSLIGLHQRKHDKLLALKKAMLQKMFPQPNATTPEIRFKGFSGEWVENEFKQIALRCTQATSEEHLPRVEYEDIISGTGRLNKDIFKKSSRKVGISFEKNDVLFGKLRPYLKNWWLAEFGGIAVGDFWIFKSAAATSNFIYCLIQTEDFERIANQSAGSKMPRSDWKLVSNSAFRIPIHIEEQQRIGNYFRTLDELIAKHAIQLQKLQQIKSACLGKMFV